MSTKAMLTAGLMDAMRSGDKVVKTTLRMALASIKNAEIEVGGELDESSVLGIIQKEVKIRQDAIEEAKRAQHPDLETAARNEIAVLEDYLPQPLKVEELEEMVKDAVAVTGASSIRDMGKVMSVLMPQVKGRAEGKFVSEIVKRWLQE